ncbi:MAG TPA: hypothetical protein VH165_22645 [Kofleriaceae bacterium]|nr:hypothetical protein [Kofleriaceae bacterium]
MKLPRGEPVATLRTTTLWSLAITSCGDHVRSGISFQNPATCLISVSLDLRSWLSIDSKSSASSCWSTAVLVVSRLTVSAWV